MWDWKADGMTLLMLGVSSSVGTWAIL